MSRLKNLNSMFNEIKKAAEIIKQGGIVAVPTETVYGLAANAFDENAVRKIFSAKGRPFIDPLIVHIENFDMLNEVAHLDTSSKKIAEKFWPGALTLVLKKKNSIPDIVTAGKDTVAVRMPKHPLMKALLKESDLPLAAPSANPFGYISPTKASHVENQLGQKVDMILDGGDCDSGVESTILISPEISDNGLWQILRFGPVTKEDIEYFLNDRIFVPQKNPAHPVAPGMLDTHYSPDTKLFLFDAAEEIPANFAGLTIHFSRPKTPQNNEYWLTENGDLKEAAHNLFSLLRTLDSKKSSMILCQRAPDYGLGLAINDRLKRAAQKLNMPL